MVSLPASKIPHVSKNSQLPTRQSNGYKTADGKEPTNLDLFLRLEKLIKKYETDEFHIGFMHIRRKHNTLADKLAKRGAEADKPPVSSSSAGLEELGKQMRKMKV